MFKFVDDVANWKKWWSMRLLILSAFFQAITVAYAALPQDWLPSIPDFVKMCFAAGALLTAGAAGVARVVDQPGLRGDKISGDS